MVVIRNVRTGGIHEIAVRGSGYGEREPEPVVDLLVCPEGDYSDGPLSRSVP